MKKLRRVARAREEVVRCNIETRQLHTAIINENTLLDRTVKDARSRGDIISGPLELFATHRRRVNARLMAVISQIYDLPGFTGSTSAGQRKGSVPGSASDHVANVPENPGEVQKELEELSRDDDEGNMDDTELGDMARLVNFAVNIS